MRGVLTLDAFARCWVQEFALFRAIEPLVGDPDRRAFARLAAEWRTRRMRQFDLAMKQMYGGAAGVMLERIADSNHYIQLDQPARFVAAVDAFMRR